MTTLPSQPVGEPVLTQLPRPRPATTAMAGQFCCLEPTRQDHAEALFNAFSEDTGGRGWTYMAYGPFTDYAVFAEWLGQSCLGDDPQFHTIFGADGRALGLASYLNIVPATGVIEIGHIHFAPALQRTAAATETMYLMLARVFDELGYRRCEWKCNDLNQPSRDAALRLGFVYEGTFRQATVVKGRNRDTAWYSMIDSEWPARRDAFRTWLSNIDAEGRQAAPLPRR